MVRGPYREAAEQEADEAVHPSWRISEVGVSEKLSRVAADLAKLLHEAEATVARVSDRTSVPLFVSAQLDEIRQAHLKLVALAHEAAKFGAGR